jgi:hypothetical protein
MKEASNMLDFSTIQVESPRSASVDQIAMPCKITPDLERVAAGILSDAGLNTEELDFKTEVDVSAFLVPFLSVDTARCWIRWIVIANGKTYTRWIEVDATVDQVCGLITQYLAKGGGVNEKLEEAIRERFFAFVEEQGGLGDLLSRLLHEDYEKDELLNLLDGRGRRNL